MVGGSSCLRYFEDNDPTLFSSATGLPKVKLVLPDDHVGLRTSLLTFLVKAAYAFTAKDAQVTLTVVLLPMSSYMIATHRLVPSSVFHYLRRMLRSSLPL